MHREIMQTPPGQVAHHEDHNPLNNRRVQPAELQAAGEPAQSPAQPATNPAT